MDVEIEREIMIRFVEKIILVKIYYYINDIPVSYAEHICQSLEG